MHVVLVSCCEKKALKRTRKLLDSYACRTGSHTWLTPITLEGLEELHKALRRLATRQTAVACFRNEGGKRMTLLWTVGNNKFFNSKGVSPVSTAIKKQTFWMPEWAKICSQIARLSGFIHDLGKFNQEFQGKLIAVNNFTKDNVRHEWLSLFIGKKLLEDNNWLNAIKQFEDKSVEFSNSHQEEKTLIFKTQLKSIADAVLYCVATHHKLPSNKKGTSVINNQEHVNHFNPEPKNFDNPKISLAPSEKILKLIQQEWEKLQTLPATTFNEEKDKFTYWRAMATLARMALILADQSISAENPPTYLFGSEPVAYANTHNGKLNQDLCWHLENVGNAAGKMLFRMLNLSLPALSAQTIEQINQLAPKQYAWQNRAAIALIDSAAKHDVPHLVLNLAGTGSGKTRMNLRAICALNENKAVRVATALNLRTLTLQTADAYHDQAGISKDEMACVIGDSLAQKLHECGKENVDEDEAEDSIEVVGDFDFELPAWLKFYTDKNPKLGDIIGAPVLVSTIDFLVAAGEPQRKHHHILAAMRLMHSDLILDEIDGYDPLPLLAVLRLVMMAALFGKNVVASSATLSKPVAKMLWEFYNHGAAMRAQLHKQPMQFRSAIIDDLTTASLAHHTKVENFLEDYTVHVKKTMAALENKCYRKPVLAEIPESDLSNETWLGTIYHWTKILHENHAWLDEKTKRRLSFGLIRIANITTAVKVAAHLATIISNCKIVCYHSNHFPLQRYHIESRLDFLLSRKNKATPNQHILDDEEIRQILDNANNDVLFIVVATPVEEIGRDHDFDWAIIEPSSSQSIVQTAGRVNRHRLISVGKPNVALLQFNHNSIKNDKTVFKNPGLESSYGNTTTHCSHDLKELFAWQALTQIDARMRFNTQEHDFAKFDDAGIEKQVKDFVPALLTETELWMAKETYTESSLRSNKLDVEMYPDLDLQDLTKLAKNYIVLSNNKEKNKPESTTLSNIGSRVTNDWLIKADHELHDDSQRMMVDSKRGLTVSFTDSSKPDEKISKFVSEKVCRHLSFGFYLRRIDS